MKTANSFGIYFTVRPDKIKEGKVPIYVCGQFPRNIQC